LSVSLRFIKLSSEGEWERGKEQEKNKLNFVMLQGRWKCVLGAMGIWKASRWDVGSLGWHLMNVLKRNAEVWGVGRVSEGLQSKMEGCEGSWSIAREVGGFAKEVGGVFERS
jgi:hypothetical protein